MRKYHLMILKQVQNDKEVVFLTLIEIEILTILWKKQEKYQFFNGVPKKK